MSTAVQTERSDAAARTGWWDAPFAVFQTNLREIDVTLDVEATLDDIQAHGADVWLLNVGGILAHYPTDLRFQTRNPHLRERPGGDLIADALAATRRRGMRLLGRMDFSKVHPRIIAEHPEWAYRSPSGELQVYEGLVSVCPRGEYYQHRLLDIVDEVLDRYAVDGFFFNWFGFNEVDYAGVVHGVCHCDACRRAWVDAQGDRPLPARVGDDGYADWKRLASAAIDDLTSRISAHIGARRPDAALILGRAADVLFHEANNAVGRVLWPWTTADAVSALRVSQPDKPVMVNAVAFVDMPYRLAGEQPEMMAQYLLQAISRGANPSTYIMGPTRGIRYPSVDAAAEVTRLHRDHRDVYAGLRPAADVAVVIPDPLSASAERAAQARREYQGVCVALREAHVPFESVAQDRLAAIDPARFTTVVLPDLTGVDDAWLERHVEAGGRIVATGASGIAEDGSTATWHPARRVVDAVSDPNALKSSYVQRGPSAPVEGTDVLPLHGTAYELEWRDQAAQDLPLIAQAAYGPPERAYGHRQGPGRARGRWRRGSGEVMALSWTPGRSYVELGLTAIRDVIAETVRTVSGPQLVEFSGPEVVEVVIGRSDAGLVIHLLNGSGQRRNSFGPVIRTGEVRLRIAGHARHHVRAIVQPEAAHAETHGDDLLVILAGVGEVEAIVIGGPDAG
ncbi:hypothetical protein HD600_001484 [Microbacterium ginsengiterrae]|uniref:Beta-galactosidase-like protein n=1 Tax=Microbacterium ginsengiterrae TaxID=546115 RepID=A0A7W9CCC1_9MICO|nr:alpha-amylase family protein [Microbacterium ginsengiterrae]MBB5742987.1 hypothetical protein [Microbacterium ginsengiterrae]